MSNVIGSYFLSLGGKWLSNKILNGKSKEAIETIKEVIPTSKPLDIEYYKKTFSDPLFKKKFEILKEHIPKLLAEFALSNEWFTIPRVEKMLDFVTDKTNKVILPDYNAETVEIVPCGTMTDIDKLKSAIWFRNEKQSNFDIDENVKLAVTGIDIKGESAIFTHNCLDVWKNKKMPVDPKGAKFILSALLEYEPNQWYAISFEAISGSKRKNIGRVLRGGTTSNPNPKYAVKAGQLVGFWIRPAFDSGMSPITWIKL